MINASCRTTNDAEHGEADETQSYVKPVAERKDYSVTISTGMQICYLMKTTMMAVDI